MWDITLNLRAGKGTSETASKVKTDCWRIASLPRLHRPCPGTSVVAQFPVLLGRSHLHVIIQVLISTLATLNFSQQETCWWLVRHAGRLWGSPLLSPQACPHPLCCALPTLTLRVPAQPLLAALPEPPPLPTATLQKPGNGRGLPGDHGELHTHPGSWEAQPLWGGHSYLMGLPEAVRSTLRPQ